MDVFMEKLTTTTIGNIVLKLYKWLVNVAN
jgi:hypothetical protein